MPDLLVVGLAAMGATAAWVLLWTAAYLSLVGATAAAAGLLRGALAEPLMILSFFWGCQVRTKSARGSSYPRTG